ncbi:MAG: hypothetical protein ABIF87_17675 [Pseudomonadota bacterium]
MFEKAKKDQGIADTLKYRKPEPTNLNSLKHPHLIDTIRWPRYGRLGDEDRVTTMELMIKEITENTDWSVLATTLSKIIGVRKFQIHPKEGMLELRFNQEQINLAKLQYVLMNHGYDIRPTSESEHTDQKTVLPPKSI